MNSRHRVLLALLICAALIAVVTLFSGVRREAHFDHLAAQRQAAEDATPTPAPTPLPTPTPNYAAYARQIKEERERVRKNALVNAAAGGNVALVRKLLREGYDPRQPSTYGETALRATIHRNYLSYLRSGKDWSKKEPPGAKNWDEIEPPASRTTIVRMLLRHGTDPKRKLDYYNGPVSPLELTLRGGYEGPVNYDIVLALLQNGANPNERFAKGGTPLGLAVKAGSNRNSMRAARYLLRFGARLERRDILGRTPLMQVADSGEIAGLRFLLSRGARVQVRDKEGDTPLLLATPGTGEEKFGYEDERLKKMRLLLQRGDRPNARNRQGQAPLLATMSAQAFPDSKKSQRVLAARLLLKNGANPNTHDARGQTPLMLAIGNSILLSRDDYDSSNYRREAIAMVQLLLQHGANPTARSPDGTTALKLLHQQGVNEPELVRLLKRWGAKE